MAEAHIVTTLRAKREEIEGYIAELEKRVARARRDLLHVTATLRLYETGQTDDVPRYADLTRLFRPREIGRLVDAALADAGRPMSTRELALVVVRAKGWNEDDADLRKSVANRIVNMCTMRWKRRSLDSPGKQRGVRLWQSKK